MKIGICAPSTPFAREDANHVIALAADCQLEAKLIFHEQCFLENGHFAGSDAARLNAFVEMANDPALNAIWFARGGYGACRIAQDAVAQLGNEARSKTYMGYSDAGNMLGALYGADIGTVAHGPMPTDIRRNGGEIAVRRALDWLVQRNTATLEQSLQAGQKHAAFNAMTLAMMVGTPIIPDLSGHILMIEEVSEYLYGFDRAMFNITGGLADSQLAGIQLGRVSDIPENDRPFGETAEEITKRWCDKSGIAYLGRADIGHDVDNKIVPFGAAI